MTTNAALRWLDKRRNNSQEQKLVRVWDQPNPKVLHLDGSVDLIQYQEHQKQVLDRKSPASKVLLNDQEQMFEKGIRLMEEQEAEEARDTVPALHEQLTTLRADLLNDQEQMFEKGIRLMEEQGAEEARDTLPALHEQLATLRADLVKRGVVRADLQNTMQVQVTRLQNERDSLRKRVTAMEDFYKIEGTTFGDLEKVNDLKRELAGAQVANAEKERIVRQMKEENEQLREYTGHLRSKLVGYEEDAKELHEEIAKMKARREADSLAIHTLERRLLERDNQHLKTLGESEEALDAHSELLARLEVVMRESEDKLLQQVQKLETRKALLQGNDRPRTASSESDGVNRK